MRFSKRFIKTKSYDVDSIGWILDREKANAIGWDSPPPFTHTHAIFTCVCTFGRRLNTGQGGYRFCHGLQLPELKSAGSNPAGRTIIK